MSDNTPVCDINALSFHGSGPQWGQESEELDVTVLSWERGNGLEAHINHELDVVLVILQGAGQAYIEDQLIALHAGMVLLIAKGQVRAITSTSDRLTYASVHRRRPALIPRFETKK